MSSRIYKYAKMVALCRVMRKSLKTLDKDLFFRALADRTRLRLLHLMGKDEVCVCFFVEILKTNQPKISRHLAYLRRAGIVGARRQGPWMHYRIVEPPDVLRDTASRQYSRRAATGDSNRERIKSGLNLRSASTAGVSGQ